MNKYGNVEGGIPMECPLCSAPLLAQSAWRDRYPEWACRTTRIAGLHRTTRCWWRGLLRRKKPLTRMQEIVEERVRMEMAAAEVEFELEMSKARAELGEAG